MRRPRLTSESQSSTYGGATHIAGTKSKAALADSEALIVNGKASVDT